MATVVLAPDSFKGGPSALQVAAELSAGWRRARPDDELVLLPLADGGEGTLDVVAAACPESVAAVALDVQGPVGGGRPVRYLRLDDRTAVVELAASSGLPLLDEPAPLAASTYGLGQVLRAATSGGSRRLVVAIGGSASTDGGTGALTALGARFLDRNGHDLPPGGGALPHLAAVDFTRLLPPPSEGVDVLVDVTTPLLGERGAAHLFAPQKGADRRQVEVLERGLTRLATCLGGEPHAPGAGAAGGTAYGLATVWGARLVPGADWLGRLVGLSEAIAGADLVVTGEGRFDRTSLQGKLVGDVLARCGAAGTPVAVVAGQVDESVVPRGVTVVDMSQVAGSEAASRREPARHLRRSAERLALWMAEGGLRPPVT